MIYDNLGRLVSVSSVCDCGDESEREAGSEILSVNRGSLLSLYERR